MKKNILLVEYDSPTIENIKDILSSSVFDISIAGEGDIAKKLIKKKKFDLLICAAMLPKFHGFELSKFSKETNQDSKVIVISGVYKGTEYRNKAIREYYADEFIEKPLNPVTFLDSVLKLLEITKDDVEGKTDPGTTQIPAFDTKKIKTPSNNLINNQNKLSSEDIFGDLIDNVENIPEHKIELDKNELPSGKEINRNNIEGNDKKNQVTQILSGDTLGKESDKKSSKSIGGGDIKIDLNDIIKQDTEKKDKKTEKKIEEDIMKKFEETLSGLGIKDHKVIKSRDVESVNDANIKKNPEKESETPKSKKDKKKSEIEGYEILGLIARGGMAEIYKAKKRGVQGFEKILAIKKILSDYGDDNKYIEMFVDEAKIASELSHPNIVQIYDFGKKDNYYFIAMEYVEGKDLRLLLRKLSENNTRLEEYISIYICLKILDALSYAHSAKDKYGNNLEIVHRDISPPNILLSYNGEVKLTDFGVSKASNKLHQTLSGALKGKLLYMSPEQARADKDIDKRSDIYSVGVILFELLTGQKLFKGSSEIEVLKKVQDGKITHPSEFVSDIDSELERIILKSLEINKSERYSNAVEMSKDLESYLYKNFNHIPTPIHINVCLYNLFKKEILKDGIRVNLNQVPFEITRITTKEDIENSEPAEKTPEKDSTEIDLSQGEVIPESTNIINLPSDDISDEVSPEDNKITPEEDDSENRPSDTPDEQKDKESSIDKSFGNKKVEKYNNSKNSTLQIPESINIEKFKKKKTVRPIYVLFFIIVAVAAGIYFLSNSFKKDKSDSVEIIPPKVNKLIKDTKNSQLTDSNAPADSSTENLEDMEKPLNKDMNSVTIPDNTTQVETGKVDSKSLTGKDNKNQLTNEDKLKEEKKKQDQIKKKQEQDKKKRLALEKKRREAEAEKKRLQEEADKKKRDEEAKLKKIEDEKKRLQEEADKKKRDEEERKRLIAEQNRAKPGQIVSLSEVDQKPIPISTPPPVLPRSIRAGSRTNILVSFLINERGTIEKIKLIRKSEKNNINSIIKKTILRWKYTPAVKDGVKVKVWRTIPLNIK